VPAARKNEPTHSRNPDIYVMIPKEKKNAQQFVVFGMYQVLTSTGVWAILTVQFPWFFKRSFPNSWSKGHSGPPPSSKSK
jgi:hypothetical protein